MAQDDPYELQVEVSWTEGWKFQASSDEGHTITIDATSSMTDEPSEGPMPKDLLLMSLGACLATNMVLILQRRRKPAQTLRIKVAGTSTKTEAFTHIHLYYEVSAPNLEQAELETQAKIAAKYCGVHKSLRGDIDLQTTVAVLRA